MCILDSRLEKATSPEDAYLKLSLAAKATKLGIHDYDIVNNRIEWDFRVREIWGVDESELINYSIFISGLHPEDVEKTQETVSNSLDPTGTGEFYAEYRVINRKDKVCRWVAAMGQTFFENDKPVRLIGTVQEITQRKKAEEDLKRSEARYRALHEGLRDAFIETDLTGKFISFNSEFRQMLGYTSDELYLFDIKYITPPPHLNSENEHVITSQILQRGYSDVYEMEFIRKNGSIVPVEVRSVLSCDQEGNPRTIWSIIRDISERIKIQKALEENSLRLNELNNQKDKFFSILAHDLKNPFSVLIGSSELALNLLGPNDMESVKRLLAMIHTAAKNGYELLENLLEWAKAQTGATRFNPENFTLKKEIEKTISGIRTFASNKSIELILDIPDDLNIFADRHMISTVIRNLAENAVKFTNSQGKVVIAAHRVLTGIEIIVTDTGKGISTDDLQKLFRLDIKFTTPGTANEKGTGLGLLLCKEFVEKHGGSIEVHSKKGKGTSIMFVIKQT